MLEMCGLDAEFVKDEADGKNVYHSASKG
jgi:hypothetical protein